MPDFQLCLLTDRPDFIACAANAGVDRIVIDLERRGKDERQQGRGLRVTDHDLHSVGNVRGGFSDLHLMVRINAPNEGSPGEIDAVIEAGATTIMLPYFREVEEADRFLGAVGGRARACLLVETAEAVSVLPELLRLPGLDEVHFGLNDLQISYGHRTLFEVFLDGTLERAAAECTGAGIPFGFGGLAPLDWKEHPLPAEFLVAENMRLGGCRCLLGRAFATLFDSDKTGKQFANAVRELRGAISRWRDGSTLEVELQHARFAAAVAQIRCGI